MIGADALVPPTVTHAPVKRTFTPVSGSATAETSPTVRLAQPASVCHVGLGSKALQPLPAPDHAHSVQPRAVAVSRVSDSRRPRSGTAPTKWRAETSGVRPLGVRRSHRAPRPAARGPKTLVAGAGRWSYYPCRLASATRPRTSFPS